MVSEREAGGRGGEAGKQGERGSEEGLRSLLQRMLQPFQAQQQGQDALPMQAFGAPGGRIISPVDIGRLLRVLRDIPLETGEAKELGPLKQELDTIVSLLQRISADLVQRQLEDGLAWIYHPLYGQSVAATRVRQLIHVLAHSIRKMWASLAESLDKLSPEDAARAVTLAEMATRLSFLVVADTYAKIQTLFFINAPPNTRPPLANAALGYEIVEFGLTPKGHGVSPPSLLRPRRGRRE